MGSIKQGYSESPSPSAYVYPCLLLLPTPKLFSAHGPGRGYLRLAIPYSPGNVVLVRFAILHDRHVLAGDIFRVAFFCR